MRAKPPRTVVDHFCGACGGYLGTTEDFRTMGDNWYEQQSRVYFGGLGIYRRGGHARHCRVMTGLEQNMPVRTAERLEHELPDGVERKDLFLAYA